MAESFQPRLLLETLVRHHVDFVLIGGMAGTARGSAFVTLDLDGQLPCTIMGGLIGEGSIHCFILVSEAVRQLRGAARGQVEGV